MIPRTILAALAVTVATAAQRTLIVDRAGNGQYREITEALRHARPGDTLLVRKGAYRPFRVGIGVTILGEPGADIAYGPWGAVRILRVPAGQELRVKGFGQTALYYSSVGLSIDECAGTVALEALRLPGLGIRRSARVSVTSCATDAIVIIEHSHVSLVESSGRGGSRDCSPEPGLAIGGSSIVDISGGSFVGADERCGAPRKPGAGISVGPAAVVRVAGPGRAVGGRGNTRVGPAAAIDNAGTVYRDPTFRLGTPATAGKGRFVRASLPALAAHGAGAGQTLHARVSAPARSTAYVLAGIPTAPRRYTLRHPVSLWVDPSALLLLGSASTGSTGTARVSVPVPSHVPAGAGLALQGLVTGAVTDLTNAVVVTLH